MEKLKLKRQNKSQLRAKPNANRHEHNKSNCEGGFHLDIFEEKHSLLMKHIITCKIIIRNNVNNNNFG